MTPEAQRIAIAEAFSVRFNESKDLYELLNPKGEWKYPYDADGDSEEHCWKYAPNYPNDLNAMHEAEKVLTEKQELFYMMKLIQVMKERHTLGVSKDLTYKATAAQRSEAFLRTIGKWEEKQP